MVEDGWQGNKEQSLVIQSQKEKGDVSVAHGGKGDEVKIKDRARKC